MTLSADRPLGSPLPRPTRSARTSPHSSEFIMVIEWLISTGLEGRKSPPPWSRP